MPFYLYELRKKGNGVEFTQTKQISLAGVSGPLAKSANAAAHQSAFGWTADENHLLSTIGFSDNEHAILIDLKPYQAENVSLYRLTKVWGYTYEYWTPLMLRMTALFTDRRETEAATFKRRFEDDGGLGTDTVHEFLYLGGGFKGGRWTWGMVGRVNGALLWPDALDYFLSDAGYTRLRAN